MDTFPPALPVEPPYNSARQNNFPSFGDQLGMLYDDILAGKFGEDAKTSQWFLTIKDVKSRFPKPVDVTP